MAKTGRYLEKEPELIYLEENKAEGWWEQGVSCRIPVAALNELAEAVQILDDLRDNKIRTGFTNVLEEQFANERFKRGAMSVLTYCGLSELL